MPHSYSTLRSCQHCGKSFTVPKPSARTRYCSHSCGSKANPRRAKPYADRYWSKVDRASAGCWLWQAARTQTGGYGSFWKDGRQERAHRVAWELTYGPIPPGMVVCHRCDTPACCRPDHLFLGTNADNLHDMLAKGRNVNPTGERNGSRLHPDRLKRGATNPSAKLTANDVREIRQLAAQGHRPIPLAQRFGVSPSNVAMIVRRVTWQHLDD